MPQDLKGLRDALRAAFPGHALDQDEGEEKTTLALRRGWLSGLDVEVESGFASVEWATKVGTLMMFVVLGVTFALMYAFAEPMLRALGLIADTGTISLTLKLFYILPLLLFIAPLMLLSSLLRTKIAPPQEGLVARAREVVVGAGLALKAEDEG